MQNKTLEELVEEQKKLLEKAVHILEYLVISNSVEKYKEKLPDAIKEATNFANQYHNERNQTI